MSAPIDLYLLMVLVDITHVSDLDGISELLLQQRREQDLVKVRTYFEKYFPWKAPSIDNNLVMQD